MREVNSHGFLENVIETESKLYHRIFENKYSSFSPNKKSCQEKVFYINSCKQLINPDFKEPEKLFPQHLNIGIGYWIYELRRLDIKDETIHRKILKYRDDFLEGKNLHGEDYETILQKKQCLEVYRAVMKGLERFANEIIS